MVPQLSFDSLMIIYNNLNIPPKSKSYETNNQTKRLSRVNIKPGAYTAMIVCIFEYV
jgi:hypothetical protein